ncbi:MAG: iron ABC transporter permease [Armatimonadetes bacterium]|nr:iron ABC transporter permease [Armatimonadota bacterium]
MPQGSRAIPLWLLLTAAVVLAFLVHVGVGSEFWYSPAKILTVIFAGPPRMDDVSGAFPDQLIIWNLRLPRACAAALVGANLGSVGAAFQALFRNPLADPYVVGISSGAAVGGVIASMLGIWAIAGGFAGIGLAFLTALASLGLVVAIARAQGVLALSTLLMAGVAVGSFLWALITFLLVSSGQDAGRVLFWLLGSLVSIDWPRVGTLALFGAVGFAFLAGRSRALTVFAVGEESAARLGVSTEAVKWTVLLAGSGMAAAAVASVGIIGFVGLFVPHICRRLTGPDMKRLLPASALMGAVGLLIADLLAQRAIPDREINVGIVTALIGAPFLVALLRRKG